MSGTGGPAAHVRASIVVIGDEILGGFVKDTNSGFLAGRLHALGIPLDRIVTVPDQQHAIDEALGTELARPRPRIVLTSGGIGATPDDLTLESVAAHLRMPLRVDEHIDAEIDRALAWSASQGAAVSDGHAQAMRKMARVPQAAYLLPGPSSVAPGVAIDVDGGLAAPAGATIVVLPGVPSELRRIMRHGVEPALLEGRGEPQHVVELTHGYPESALNPVLERVVAEFPAVHLGSYPGRECLVRLKGERREVERAAAVIREGLAALDASAGSARLRELWQRRWA